MAGDFNFPSTITTWEPSDIGVIPNPIDGDMERKQGFAMLTEVTEEHGLTQLVNKATHGKEILDLVYASHPEAFSDCQTTIISPESDHHLVKFEVITNLKNFEEGYNMSSRPKWIPEVATYDFHSANKEKLKKA